MLVVHIYIFIKLVASHKSPSKLVLWAILKTENCQDKLADVYNIEIYIYVLDL